VGADSDSYELVSLYSAVLVFNYALSLHQKGDQVSLHRAVLLYEHCLELLGAINDCFDCDIVASEALANLADIRYKQGDFVGLRSVMDLRLQLGLKRIISSTNYDHQDGEELVHKTAPAA
jgi:hypothetical protein